MAKQIKQGAEARKALCAPKAAMWFWPRNLAAR